MISRYALFQTTQLENRFGLTTGLPKGVKPRYNVGPTMDQPVIVTKDNKTTIELMSWGLVAHGSKDLNSIFRYKTYNVPSEKVMSKHSWEIAVKQNRCLIPVNGYYASSRGQKLTDVYYIHSETEPILALAGVYTSLQSDDGTVHGMFSMLTTEAEGSLQKTIDRVPVVIGRNDQSEWLDASITDANSLYRLFRAYEQHDLTMHQVSQAIYAKKTEGSQLIEKYQ